MAPAKQEQAAKNKAKELLQDVGQKLSAKEAQQIARKADIPVKQVSNIASRNQVAIQPAVQKLIEATKQTTSPNSAPAAGGGGGVKAAAGGGSNPAAGGGGGVKVAAGGGSDPAAGGGGGVKVAAGGEAMPQPVEKAQADQQDKPDYTSVFRDALDAAQKASQSYQDQLNDYSSRFADLSNKYQDALAQQQVARADYDALVAKQKTTEQAATDAAKQKAAELEAQKQAKDQADVDAQLRSLRGGYSAAAGATVGSGVVSSGTPGGGGRTSKIDFRKGGLLEQARKKIDVTDSVLEKNPLASSNGSESLVVGARRSQARQRAQAANGLTSGYYARRFG